VSDSFPAFIPPMLATAGLIFNSNAWIYEPKWDGIRCLACYNGQLRLYTRNGNDISQRFPEMAILPNYLPTPPWMIDGELIVLNTNGKPSFDLVRQRNMVTNPAHSAQLATMHPAILATFDLLHLGERSLLAEPLHLRRQLLQQSLQKSNVAFTSPGLVGGGCNYYNAMVQTGLEGVVIKKLDSLYEPGQRSKRWIKVRATRQADCVIGGFTPKGANCFGSLLVGQYGPGNRLLYVGSVGSGFTSAQQHALCAHFALIRTDSPSLTQVPANIAQQALWVQPRLVSLVEFLLWSPAGVFRHPVFRGLRTDKLPEECLLDNDHPANEEGVF
jgi:bifunctional non-homologous end joining protein LigD